MIDEGNVGAVDTRIHDSDPDAITIKGAISGE